MPPSVFCHFGVSEPTARRTVGRVLPLLEAAGLDTMRLPDPGKDRRPGLDALLAETPDLAVLIDTFEQRVQRPQDRRERTPTIAARRSSTPSRCRWRWTSATGASSTWRRACAARPTTSRCPIGDLAYVGIADTHPAGVGATPRRKPRGRPRPPEDSAYNRAFARRRVQVDHRIRCVRLYEALTQPDRHHRRGHTRRVRAVVGLVNRHLPPAHAA